MYLSQDKIFRANNVKQILFHNIFCKEKTKITTTALTFGHNRHLVVSGDKLAPRGSIIQSKSNAVLCEVLCESKVSPRKIYTPKKTIKFFKK